MTLLEKATAECEKNTYTLINPKEYCPDWVLDLPGFECPDTYRGAASCANRCPSFDICYKCWEQQADNYHKSSDPVRAPISSEREFNGKNWCADCKHDDCSLFAPPCEECEFNRGDEKQPSNFESKVNKDEDKKKTKMTFSEMKHYGFEPGAFIGQWCIGCEHFNVDTRHEPCCSCRFDCYNNVDSPSNFVKFVEKDGSTPPDNVAHPAHYVAGRKYEPKDVIRDWGLNYNLGCVVKYVSRAGRKNDIIEDLRKARQYLDFEIEALVMEEEEAT